MSGYIKDYRQELKSDIWYMPPLYHRVWQYIKYKVNHQDFRLPMRDGSHLLIKSGQHLSSIRTIGEGVSWYEGHKHKIPNTKTIKTILNWLEDNHMISIERGKGNRQYTLITLVNWDSYQATEIKGNSRVTEKLQDVPINKNDNNEKKNIIAHLNDVAGTNYRDTSKKTLSLINTRLTEGFKKEDFIQVIDKKNLEWHGTEMEKYLRPSTLFGSKFESYLNQPDVLKQTSDQQAIIIEELKLKYKGRYE